MIDNSNSNDISLFLAILHGTDNIQSIGKGIWIASQNISLVQFDEKILQFSVGVYTVRKETENVSYNLRLINLNVIKNSAKLSSASGVTFLNAHSYVQDFWRMFYVTFWETFFYGVHRDL